MGSVKYGGAGTALGEGSSLGMETKRYNLDEDVAVWSDFLRLHLHPRTVHIINDFCHASDFEPFDVHCFGQNVLRNRGFSSSIEDSLHYFVEECDSLQGFQVMVDAGDGFGGLGADWLENLSDEYSSKSIFTFAMHDYDPNAKRDSVELKSKHILNSALAFDRLREYSTLYIPLSISSHTWELPSTPLPIPGLQFNSSLRYHTSAIIGAAIDTVTLPYRLNTSAGSPGSENWRSMDRIGGLFTGMSEDMNIASLSCALPFPLRVDQKLFEAFHEMNPLKTAPSLRQLTPVVSAEVTCFVCLCTAWVYFCPLLNTRYISIVENCVWAAYLSSGYPKGNKPKSTFPLFAGG